MKYIDEYRDAAAARKVADSIARLVTRPWTLMEICGGQTHSIVKYGIDLLLPESVTMVHGPGCPVCVTSIEAIDKALMIARQPRVIFCSFGDMLRVPGTQGDLFSVKAAGGDVRIVYSPMDALKIARQNPEREVVFFAVGFETTAPPNAMAGFQARRLGVNNFSLLVSHVLVPPAMEALLSAPDNLVNGFLAAGHVCTVMGIHEYEPIAAKYHVPIVATGFEPLDILQGIHLCLEQLEAGKAEATIQYGRSVRPEGNPTAQKMVADVFHAVDRKWRGIGMIPQSGWALRPEYDPWNAEKKFGVEGYTAEEPAECVSGAVLRGVAKPCECPAFGNKCTPEHPLGAPMVSSEGACSAYYRYRR